MVLQVCRRVLGHSPAAEDAFQATFVVLARKAATLRTPARLGAWLHGVARHAALHCRDSEQARQRRETRAARQDGTRTQADPLEELSARELLLVLDEEVHRLPERYRLPLILCGLEGQGIPEAARQLGWSVDCVSWRLARGRARLKARLARRGITLSAAAAAVLLCPRVSEAALSATLISRAVVAAIGSGTSARVEVVAAAVVAALRPAVLTPLRVSLALLLGAGLAVAGWAGVVCYNSATDLPGTEPAAAAPVEPEVFARTDLYGDPLPEGALARLGTVRLRASEHARWLACRPHSNTFLSLSDEDNRKMVLCAWDLGTGRLLWRREMLGWGLGGTRLSEDGKTRSAAALSPDGRTLAASIVDIPRKKVRVVFLDAASGDLVAELAGVGPMQVQAVAFSQDGRKVATAGDGYNLRLWDRATGQLLRRFEASHDCWVHLAFAPDGNTLVSASHEGAVRFWETATGRSLNRLRGSTDPISALLFSPDGKILATASLQSKLVRLWDPQTGQEVRQLRGESGTCAVAFSPDGRLLATGDGDRNGSSLTPSPLRLWDVATGKPLRRCLGHLFGVEALAFSADGTRVVSSGTRTSLHVWDVATGDDRLPFPEHQSVYLSMTFSPDGKTLATAGTDGAIRLWNPASQAPARLLASKNCQFWSIDFTADGQTLLTHGDDGWIRFWDMASGSEQYRVGPMGSSAFSNLELSPDRRTVAVHCSDGTLRLLDVRDAQHVRQLPTGPRGDPLGLCFSANGNLLASITSTDCGGVIRVLDTATEREVHSWTGTYWRMALSPDGRTLAASEGNLLPAGQDQRTFHLWDLAHGTDRSFTTTQRGRVFAMAFSPDGRMLAWGDTWGGVTLWDLAAGKVRRRLAGHSFAVLKVLFSPDGKTLASESMDTTVLLWDVMGRPGGRSSSVAAAELDRLWQELASEDAGRAFDAVRLLAAYPTRSVPLLGQRLKPAGAAPAQPRGLPLAPAHLREVRAVEVLEHVATPEALRVLQSLAAGAARARLTQEAQSAIQRLARRRGLEQAATVQ